MLSPPLEKKFVALPSVPRVDDRMVIYCRAESFTLTSVSLGREDFWVNWVGSITGGVVLLLKTSRLPLHVTMSMIRGRPLVAIVCQVDNGEYNGGFSPGRVLSKFGYILTYPLA